MSFKYKGELIAGSGGGSSEEVYSTEETRIGTWIDGRPLYSSIQESTIGGSLFDSGDDVIVSTSITSEETGSSEPFSILPPYYILAFIMKI